MYHEAHSSILLTKMPVFSIMSEDSDSGMSWLVWIGILLFVNLLSWIFDWSFWVY